MKFVAFSTAPNKFTSFLGADLERSIQVWLKHSNAFQCHWIRLLPQFLDKAIYLLDKRRPIKFQLCCLFGSSKQIDQFLGGWFGKEHSVLAQTFESPSVSLNKTHGKVFGSGNAPFRQKKPLNSEICTPFPCSKQIGQVFFGGVRLIWKNAFSFGPNVLKPFSVTE